MNVNQTMHQANLSKWTALFHEQRQSGDLSSKNVMPKSKTEKKQVNMHKSDTSDNTTVHF